MSKIIFFSDIKGKLIFFANISSKKVFFEKNPSPPPPEYQMDLALREQEGSHGGNISKCWSLIIMDFEV